MLAEIARIQRALNVTTIYVTHDQSEAMTLGDRVAVMRKGELQQLDVPQRLYDTPVNLFVAEFIGSPAMNLVEALVERENGSTHVVFGPNRLEVPGETGLADYAGRGVALGIRPEDMEDATVENGAPAGRTLDAVVDIREDMGSEIYLHFHVHAPPVTSDEVKEASEAEAIAAIEEEAEKRGDPFVARVDRESRAREGEKVRLVVDTRRLHFFDLETGRAIRS
jgi:multiple sugar transport system ATP-binding protein